MVVGRLGSKFETFDLERALDNIGNKVVIMISSYFLNNYPAIHNVAYEYMQIETKAIAIHSPFIGVSKIET